MRYRREFVTSAPLSWMPVHAEPLGMRTNVVDFRVIRRLYRREWIWLCMNQQPWQRSRGHGEWRRTSIAHSYRYIILYMTRQWLVRYWLWILWVAVFWMYIIQLNYMLQHHCNHWIELNWIEFTSYKWDIIIFVISYTNFFFAIEGPPYDLAAEKCIKNLLHIYALYCKFNGWICNMFCKWIYNVDGWTIIWNDLIYVNRVNCQLHYCVSKLIRVWWEFNHTMWLNQLRNA